MTTDSDDKLGDCFQVAYRLVTNDYVADPTARICHGIVTGLGVETYGRRFWHAWVEVGEGSETVVVERSNGLDVDMSRDVYYMAGTISDDEVWRYTRQEAYRQTTYGPWVDGWQDMTEEP